MMHRRRIFFLIILILCAKTIGAYAQVAPVDSLVSKGDSLRRAYCFEQSLEEYSKALELATDTTYADSDSGLVMMISDKILLSENGRNMTGFVYKPTVVAKHMFSKEDFFLYYPLRDRSWRAVPDQLDTVSGPYAKALYAPADAESIYFSAVDKSGIRNIYLTEKGDSLWTIPSLINEHVTSPADEIYPILSQDGKSLYFASKGLYGVGGYDLYVSQWDEEAGDWAVPVNMGFPYSSPANDFLLAGSEDGKYTVFASDRDCPSDSVWVYVLEFDNVPVRRSVRDSEELSEIAKLVPDASVSDHQQVRRSSKSPEIHEYMIKLEEVKKLRDLVSYYSALAAEGKSVEELGQLRDSLNVSQSRLHQMEMKLLMKGFVIDLDKLVEEEDDRSEAQRGEYVFTRKSFGGALNMKVEVPEVKFDYSFKVLDVAQCAEDQTIPSGVVYQIQIFASKKKATLKSLKGLSPVYETKGANGHIVYRVGLFRTYSDVLGHLNTVKKVGFRNAFISAYIDGKPVTVATARSREKQKPVVQEFYEVRIKPEGGELDSSVAAGIRQQVAGKDIAKSVGGDGVAVYVVGPFSDKAKAEELALFVKAMGISDVVFGVIKK